MEELERSVLTGINGGSTCPSYDITDNYNAVIYQTQVSAPYAIELLKMYWKDIMKYIFL
jgi:hypothetical protein